MIQVSSVLHDSLIIEAFHRILLHVVLDSKGRMCHFPLIVFECTQVSLYFRCEI